MTDKKELEILLAAFLVKLEPSSEVIAEMPDETYAAQRRATAIDVAHATIDWLAEMIRQLRLKQVD